MGIGLRPGAKAPDEPPTPYRLRASPRLYSQKYKLLQIGSLRRQKYSSGTTNLHEPVRGVGQMSVLRTPPGCGSTPSAS